MSRSSCEYTRAWRKANPEKTKEYSRRASEKYREKNPNYQKEWYQNNKELFTKLALDWRKKNYEKVLCINRNRHALKKLAQGSHTSEDINNLFIIQTGLCNGCDHNLEKYHVDHILPLSRGGSNGPGNLQLLCPACNTSKGSKTMDEWNLTKKVSINVIKK